jgi:pimeloyl-ACP methyl ester carboxylesterase
MAYWQWGDPRNERVVLCCHGLTRSGRDMDALARRLAARYRVVCPDMIGRGRSDWAENPALYQVPQYAADCVTLIARLDVESLAWVGTSMGGLIGMVLAAARGTPINRLVLNDVGPELAPAGLERIRNYVGTDPAFDSFEEGAAHVKAISAGFGPLNEEQWRMLTQHYVVQRDGRWRFHYDPAIRQAFQVSGGVLPNLWPLYDAIGCPTLVVRGELSDLLSDDLARRMTERGPMAQRVDVPGVGHAPTFIPEDQIDIVDRFLTAC